MELKSRKQFVVTEDLLASKGQRFSNFLMDVFAQLVLLMVFLNILIVGGWVDNNSAVAFLQHTDKNQLALYTISSALMLFYYNVFEILFSRTFGKLMTKTIVVDRNGEIPDYQTILARSLCRLLPFFPFSFLGMPTLGWHDRISKTYVVRKEDLKKAKELYNSLDGIGETE